MRSYMPTFAPNLVQLRRAAELIQQAERPVIFTGGGAVTSGASEALTTLATEYHIPVVSSLMGLSAFPNNSPLFKGFVGMHGRFAANKAVSDTDLLIAIGTRFTDRVTGKISEFAKKAKIVHIDIDPTSIRKNVEVDVPIVADCREAVQGLLNVLRAQGSKVDFAEKHKAWSLHLDELGRQYPLTYIKSDTEIKPQEAIEVISQNSDDDAIVATDVGQHQMWTAQFYSFKSPRSFITSGGLGTMGFGLPAAMGAQIALPDRQVVLIAGDGSIQMNIQELATLVQNKIPVKVFILNNRYLGMVRQWQELFYDRSYSSTIMEGQPDFVKLAEAYGAEGYRIEKKEDLVSVVQQALRSPHPAIVDITVVREENVYPMVPAGAGLDEMLMI